MSDLEIAKLKIDVHVLEMLVVTLLIRSAMQDGKHWDNLHKAAVEDITDALSKIESQSVSQDALRVEALYMNSLDRIFSQVRGAAEKMGLSSTPPSKS